MIHFYDGLGFAGALCVLGAYFMVSRGRWKPRSPSFQLLNILGSALLVVYSLIVHALPNVILNIVWIAIGVVTIGQAVRKSSK